MNTKKLHGIFTPNMVPLDDRGRINEPELRKNLLKPSFIYVLSKRMLISSLSNHFSFIVVLQVITNLFD